MSDSAGTGAGRGGAGRGGAGVVRAAGMGDLGGVGRGGGEQCGVGSPHNTRRVSRGGSPAGSVSRAGLGGRGGAGRGRAGRGGMSSVEWDLAVKGRVRLQSILQTCMCVPQLGGEKHWGLMTG